MIILTEKKIKKNEFYLHDTKKVCFFAFNISDEEGIKFGNVLLQNHFKSTY